MQNDFPINDSVMNRPVTWRSALGALLAMVGAMGLIGAAVSAIMKVSGELPSFSYSGYSAVVGLSTGLLGVLLLRSQHLANTLHDLSSAPGAIQFEHGGSSGPAQDRIHLVSCAIRRHFRVPPASLRTTDTSGNIAPLITQVQSQLVAMGSRGELGVASSDLDRLRMSLQTLGMNHVTELHLCTPLDRVVPMTQRHTFWRALEKSTGVGLPKLVLEWKSTLLLSAAVALIVLSLAGGAAAFFDRAYGPPTEEVKGFGAFIKKAIGFVMMLSALGLFQLARMVAIRKLAAFPPSCAFVSDLAALLRSVSHNGAWQEANLTNELRAVIEEIDRNPQYPLSLARGNKVIES